METKQLVQQHIRLKAVQGGTDSESSFYVADLEDVIQKYGRWQQTLPGVTPYFAVKSSYDRRLLEILASCGAGFDCASAEEIELVLKLGVSAERLIFTHPCKPVTAVQFARRVGVKLLTFDNEDELRKVNVHYPEAHMVLRMFADDSTGQDPLGTKFGAANEDIPHLVLLAKELGMKLEGASFHAGEIAYGVPYRRQWLTSMGTIAPSVANPQGYVHGVQNCAELFAVAYQHGLKPSILDIGGGYTDTTFEQIAAAVKPAIGKNFGAYPGVRVIAEPGTFFSCSPFYLAVKVVGRRHNAFLFNSEPRTRLYLNDGIYSNFMMHFIVNMTFSPTAVVTDGIWYEVGQGPFEYSLWGRTCDSNDCINRRCFLDREISIGDWLIFKDMGAYTTVCGTSFNGFTNPNHVIYIEPGQDRHATRPLKSLL